MVEPPLPSSLKYISCVCSTNLWLIVEFIESFDHNHFSWGFFICQPSCQGATKHPFILQWVYPLQIIKLCLIMGGGCCTPARDDNVLMALLVYRPWVSKLGSRRTRCCGSHAHKVPNITSTSEIPYALGISILQEKY